MLVFHSFTNPIIFTIIWSSNEDNTSSVQQSRASLRLTGRKIKKEKHVLGGITSRSRTRNLPDNQGAMTNDNVSPSRGNAFTKISRIEI